MTTAKKDNLKEAKAIIKKFDARKKADSAQWFKVARVFGQMKDDIDRQHKVEKDNPDFLNTADRQAKFRKWRELEFPTVDKYTASSLQKMYTVGETEIDRYRTETGDTSANPVHLMKKYAVYVKEQNKKQAELERAAKINEEGKDEVELIEELDRISTLVKTLVDRKNDVKKIAGKLTNGQRKLVESVILELTEAINTDKAEVEKAA